MFLKALLKLLTSVWDPIMISPLLKTEPAKLMGALSTKNMITPLVLLNRLATLQIRTHLSIGHNPLKTCRLIRALESPLPEHFTIGWPMLLLATLEAKLIPAFTIYDRKVVR